MLDGLSAGLYEVWRRPRDQVQIITVKRPMRSKSLLQLRAPPPSALSFCRSLNYSNGWPTAYKSLSTTHPIGVLCLKITKWYQCLY